MKNVIFRPIQKSDYHMVADIISDTWGYRKFCGDKTAHKMGLLYLASCLCNQTFNMVTVKDNDVVGVIMGNDVKNSKTYFSNRILLTKSSIQMVLSSEGRKIVKMFNGFDNINKDLLKDSKKIFDGELSFFAVKEETRGTGVGGKLYEYLIEYFQNHGIKNFYLFTDTSCNYSFYEHKGIERIGEKTIDFKPYDDRTMTFFLYSKDIEAIADGK